jgi:hypothetical protein
MHRLNRRFNLKPAGVAERVRPMQVALTVRNQLAIPACGVLLTERHILVALATGGLPGNRQRQQRGQAECFGFGGQELGQQTCQVQRFR